VDPTYLKPSTTADPRTRGSVRRASGFVQIPITLKTPIAEGRTDGANLVKSRGGATILVVTVKGKNFVNMLKADAESAISSK
jgi:hypothetical protein